MTFKKINAWLHLWLGLGSGLIVFIVSITGCIYVFEDEITSLYQPYKFVEARQQPFLQPTQLINAAQPKMGEKKPNSIRYGQKDESVTVSNFNRKEGTSTVVYMNPYTAQVLHTDVKTKKDKPDFFRFILNGHRTLWLPHDIGKQVVGVGVLVFVILLISGIVLWWPKKWIKSIRDKSFKIKWNTSFKRKNYDLHNVLGFYACLFLLLIALTGLVFSYKWYSSGLYWLTSGGKSLPEFRRPLSDTTSMAAFQPSGVDKVYNKVVAENKDFGGMFINLPAKAADAISLTVYLKAGTYYKANSYDYDQYTLMPLANNSPFGGKYKDAGIGDKLRRMNYDLHVGSIFGIPSKIIAFLASLISASLPITGFIIWYGKKFKKKKKAKNKPGITKPKVHRASQLKESAAI